MTTIEPLRPENWHAAIDCALAWVPPEQRAERVQHCLQLLAAGTLDPRGVFVARTGDTIHNVQICVALAGAACLFWLPAQVDEHADELIDAALTWARSQGCKIAQALAHPDDRVFAEPLCRRGFRPITQLHQLTHDLTDLPPLPDMPLRLLPMTPAREADFAKVLERTYVGTLDCPELNGVRTIAEIIDGHRAQGRFDPEMWWLAYDGATPIGVVMLVELPDAVTWELAYVGIVPEARRRGLGRALMVYAMHAVSRRAALALTLSVDGRNLPARALYGKLGFVEVDCSDVLLFLSEPSDASK